MPSEIDDGPDALIQIDAVLPQEMARPAERTGREKGPFVAFGATFAAGVAAGVAAGAGPDVPIGASQGWLVAKRRVAQLYRVPDYGSGGWRFKFSKIGWFFQVLAKFAPGPSSFPPRSREPPRFGNFPETGHAIAINPP